MTKSAHQQSNSAQQGAKRTRRRVRPDILRRIEALAGDVSGPTIEAELREQFGNAAPSLRTIQDVVQEFQNLSQGDDQSAAWSVATASGSQSALVLPVLAAVVTTTHGEVQSFTRHEAAWVARLRRAAPALDPYLAWVFARNYLLRLRRSESTSDLDLALASASLDDQRAQQEYLHLVETGRVPAGALEMSIFLSRNNPTESELAKFLDGLTDEERRQFVADAFDGARTTLQQPAGSAPLSDLANALGAIAGQSPSPTAPAGSGDGARVKRRRSRSTASKKEESSGDPPTTT